MTKRYVPTGKMSKRDKRLADLKRRVTWEFSPVSRVRDGKKAYKRLRAGQCQRDE